VQLFERRPSGVVPTPHGEALAKHARNIVKAWRDVQAEMQHTSAGLSGALHLGAGSVWSLRAMPRAIARLKAEFPGLTLILQTDVADALLPRLETGDLDLFLGSIADSRETDLTALVHLRESRIGAFVRAGHPLAKARKPPIPAELPAFPWATHTHDVKGPGATAQYFKRHGVSPRTPDLRFSSLVALLATLQASDAIGFVTCDIGEEAEARGLLELKLPGQIWSYPNGIAYRRSLGTLMPVRRLIEILREG
jgi:DNA-binding transcriptional LysR family regulator